MISLSGIPQNIFDRKIFRIAKSCISADLFSPNVIRVCSDTIPWYAMSPILTNIPLKGKKDGVYNLSESDLERLHESDIVAVSPSGEVFLLWENESNQNLLFLTDFCNSRCIMCPQEQCYAPKNYYDEAIKILDLVQKTPNNLCLSGGEPTFLSDEYLNVVNVIKKKFPSVYLQILTNGKKFSDFEFTKKCVLASPKKTSYAIPLYSANSRLHDYIVGAKGSFSNSIKGIYNLYKFKQEIEIRIVITKNNFHDLSNLAHFVYWNLPFVHHIAFMGMETHGCAQENLEEIWIEPSEYISLLEEAVSFLNARLMNVSIYNLPHCLLSPRLYKYARDSISEWKKGYLPECLECYFNESCAGVFTTSCKIPSGIHSIKK